MVCFPFPRTVPPSHKGEEMNEATITECGFCGKEFEDVTGNRKYCSIKCANSKNAQSRKGLTKKAANVRRWVSSSHNLEILEPMDEIRSNETGRLQAYKSIVRDETVQERDLIRVCFRPAVIAVPCGINEYEFKTVGECKTDDVFRIQLLEHAEEQARKRGDLDYCREYPLEQEEQTKRDGICKGNADTRVKDVAIEE